MNAAGARAGEPAPIHAWADLLTRQLAALETGDFEAYLAIASASEAAAEIARHAQPDPAALQACAELLDAVQDRLRIARDLTRNALGDLDERTPAVLRYAPGTPASMIDVRL